MSCLDQLGVEKRDQILGSDAAVCISRLIETEDGCIMAPATALKLDTTKSESYQKKRERLEEEHIGRELREG